MCIKQNKKNWLCSFEWFQPVLVWIMRFPITKQVIGPDPELVQLRHVPDEPLYHIMSESLTLSEATGPETDTARRTNLVPVVKTSLLITIPFQETGVIGFADCLIGSWSMGDCLCWTVLCTFLAVLTVLDDTRVCKLTLR